MVLALGASTGGVDALTRVLAALPAEAPPILVVQHMPSRFTTSFAERLATTCRLEVKEAADGDAARIGRVLIAPGGRHMRLSRNAAGGYQVRVSDEPPVSHQRPSVDVLFDSVAEHAGGAGVAAILTGMGDDGAAGLWQVRQAGGATIAQDRASCVVFGMPAAAIARGAAQQVLPLDEIADHLMELASRRERAGSSVAAAGGLSK